MDLNKIKFLPDQKFENGELHNWLYENTFFLPSVSSIQERRYCINHTIKEIPKCEICGHPTIFKNNKFGYTKTCSKECFSILMKKQNNDSCRKEQMLLNQKITQKNIDYQLVNQKRKATNKKLIGFENFGQSPIIKEKIKNTNMLKYGTNSYFASEKHKSFIKNYLNSPEYQKSLEIIKEKRINHFISNYEVENPSQIHILNTKEWLDKKLFERRCEILDWDIFDITEYFGVSSRHTIDAHIRKFNIKTTLRSKLENNFSLFLDSINVSYKTNTRSIVNGIELDFMTDKNVAFELNGSYWHSIIYKPKKFHQTKSIKCREQGIRLIHIYEDEWNNPLKRKILEEIIIHALKLSNYKIFARKCIIKEIDNKEYRNFVEENHIQGYCPASVKLGLFYENKLVQIASFGKCRFNKNYEWEWIRGCPASNNIIIGGTSKLFKYFIKTYNPNNVICFADLNKFDGAGYESCGFKLDCITGPDKFYIQKRKRISRNPYKYQEFKELNANGKILTIYGAGNLKYIWIKK